MSLRPQLTGSCGWNLPGWHYPGSNVQKNYAQSVPLAATRYQALFASSKVGGAGGGSPRSFFLSKYSFYLNMLVDDALVNISNCCNLYYISYIKKKTRKSLQGPYFACCLLVSKAAREKLEYALWVPFCIAPPSYCICWQQPGLIWDVRACETATSSPRVKKFWSAPRKIAYHTRTAPSFCAGFFCKA